MLSKPLQIQQPANIVFNYSMQGGHTHTQPTPSLLKGLFKILQANENFQHSKKDTCIVIWFLIFHRINIHIFAKHKWSGSGQNYSWAENTLGVAEDWGAT